MIDCTERLILVIFTFASTIYAFNVFLIGDSIDRQTVREWCSQQKVEHAHKKISNDSIVEYEWGPKALTYTHKASRMASLICFVSRSGHNNSLAFLHAFGSSDQGPYLNSFGSLATGDYQDTKPRIELATRTYRGLFGYFPDIIYLQFAMWDAIYLLKQDEITITTLSTYATGTLTPAVPRWNTTIQSFRANMIKRIEHAQSLVGHKANIALRTAVWPPDGGLILREFNNITRDLAEEYNLIIYDADKDIHAIIPQNVYKVTEEERHDQLFVDWIHPHDYIVAVMGEKEVGLQYTKNIKFRHFQSHFDDLFINFLDNDHKVRLIRYEGVVYGVDIHKRSKFHITNDYLRALHAGAGDVLDVNEKIFQRLPESNPVPKVFGERSICHWNATYFILYKYMLRVMDPSIYYNLRYNETNPAMVIQDDSKDHWFFSLPKYGALPLYFNKANDKLFLRYSSEKVVHLILKGKRHYIGSSKAFFRFGSDFSEVINEHVKTYLDFFPKGVPETLN